jgi:HSP20 family protein
MVSKLDPRGWFNRTEKHAEGLPSPIHYHYPLSHIHHEIDRVFDDLFGKVSHYPEEMASQFTAISVYPNIDISETESAYQITADLPGVEEKDIKVELAGNMLNISGERKSEYETKEKHFHQIERICGSFHRAISLPPGCDPASIKAKFKKGVLNINMHKKAVAKPKVTKINIETERD